MGLMCLSALAFGCGGSGGGADSAAGGGTTLPTGNATGGVRNPVCTAGQSTGEVQAPVFRMKLNGQTSWYASPVLADLDGDGKNELIAAYYSVYVFNSQGQLLDRVDDNGGRIYAPHVVVDLEGDGVPEVVFGARHEVYAYEWRNGGLEPESRLAGRYDHGRRVAGGARAGGGRSQRRRPDRGRGHHHPDPGTDGARRSSSSHQRHPLPTRRAELPGLAALQQPQRHGRGCRPQRHGAQRLRLLRSERRHRQHRRR